MKSAFTQKHLSKVLLLGLLLSAGLHLLLLQMPFSARAPKAIKHAGELRVVTAARADFVPDAVTNDRLAQPPITTRQKFEQKTKQKTQQKTFQPAQTKRPPVPHRPAELRAKEVAPVTEETDLVAATAETAVAPDEITETLKPPAAAQPVATAPHQQEPGAPQERISSLAVAQVTPVFRNAVPRYATNPLPVYPKIARRNGWHGEVLLQVSVSADGRVKQLQVQQSSGFGVLDRVALKTVKQWQFIPAKQAGHAVASDVLVPVEFRLKETF